MPTRRLGPRRATAWIGGVSCLLSLQFALGCDKAPTKPEPPTQGTSTQPRPAPSENQASPEQARDEAGEPRLVTEPNLAPPEFDDEASEEFRQSFSELSEWVKKKGGVIHAALVDLQSDKWLLRADSKKAVNPASNAKVLTAAAALELLGPGYQFETELLGSIGAEGSCPRLVLRGGGAPDLSSADLWRLLRVAEGQGLASVGDIVVDASRFTDSYVPPAFEQQPKEWAPFRAPISALAVNENAVTLNVVATEPGKEARVWYDPAGVVSPSGKVMTSERGSGDRVTWNLDPKDNAQLPGSIVGGSLAADLGRRRYARRLEDPRLVGGYAFAELLKDSGVLVKGKVELGSVQKEPRIAVWYSKPLAEIVRALGKESNNFVAEMLLVALSQAGEEGDSAKKPWSPERGAEKLRTWLASKKIPLDGLVIKNGSGLFDANRMSAELLTRVLATVEDNPRIYQDFVSHLAMGATDGTMKNRMQGSDLGERIRAKTGTLNGVDALTGYVQRPGGKSPAAFSIIVVGAKASHGEIRNRVDALVLDWAKML